MNDDVIFFYHNNTGIVTNKQSLGRHNYTTLQIMSINPKFMHTNIMRGQFYFIVFILLYDICILHV